MGYAVEDWQLAGTYLFPIRSKIAIQLMILYFQSENVHRAYKAVIII